MTGTEGTCVIVLEAEVQLVPRPKCKALGLLSFDDVYAAADAVPALLEQDLDAIEGFDGRCTMRSAIERGLGGLAAFPEGRGFLIVEAGGDSLEKPKPTSAARSKRRDTGARTALRLRSRASSSGSGKRARRRSESPLSFPGGPEHWPGWEDSAVPPDKLGDYLRELDKLLAEHGYTAALYGHFGDGVTHGRINFDFHSEAGLENYRQFMREAAQLVHRYGGSLSGEHGDGQARAELLRVMYGDELVQAFREFKAIWDPG